MEHHKLFRICSPPDGETRLCFEVELNWGATSSQPAVAVTGIRTRASRLQTQPSTAKRSIALFSIESLISVETMLSKMSLGTNIETLTNSLPFHCQLLCSLLFFFYKDKNKTSLNLKNIPQQKPSCNLSIAYMYYKRCLFILFNWITENLWTPRPKNTSILLFTSHHAGRRLSILGHGGTSRYTNEPTNIRPV